YDLFGAGQFHHVLIIGAGSGSDTAIGLKYGQVGHIDAVEIDPVIARLGTQFHPEQPFSDPRVDVHIDDGRSFLRKSTDTYDRSSPGRSLSRAPRHRCSTKTPTRSCCRSSDRASWPRATRPATQT